jgi:hypothetical protein
VTDANNAGIIRETLLTTVPAARVGGVIMETLLTTPTAATFASVVREVLYQQGVVAVLGQQTSVTINTS